LTPLEARGAFARRAVSKHQAWAPCKPEDHKEPTVIFYLFVLDLNFVLDCLFVREIQSKTAPSLVYARQVKRRSWQLFCRKLFHPNSCLLSNPRNMSLRLVTHSRLLLNVSCVSLLLKSWMIC
jgi:hypothetical protein